MSRALRALREWVRPGSVQQRSIPPLEAGARPNSRLDEAIPLTAEGLHEPDDVAITADGAVWFSAGREVLCIPAGGDARIVADVGGAAGALRTDPQTGHAGVLAAVEGRGIVAVAPGGAVSDRWAHELLRRTVTDFAVLADGRIAATIGTASGSAADWAVQLLREEADGRLVVADGASASVVAEGLAWPSGVEAVEGGLLVAESLGLRVQRRSADGGGAARDVLHGMAGYPGRIRRGPDGCWIAVPALRNRATELIVSEPAVRDDMIANIAPELWLVPTLRSENVYRDPLQIGQQRVMGVIKPWAPPRSYGLAVLLGDDDRITDSVHSRPDGRRHGVTGVAVRDDRLLVACRGSRVVLEVRL